MTDSTRSLRSAVLRSAMALAASIACAFVLVAGASAQDGSGCYPSCRTGFVCQAGRCVSACNPGCADDEMCSPAGECVSRCNPICGAGERCTPEGACVAAPQQAQAWSSPPPQEAPPAQAGLPPQAAPAQQGWLGGSQVGPQTAGTQPGFDSAQLSPPGSADPGWARGAGITGLVSAALVGILTGATVALVEDGDESSRALGGITTLGFGVAGIVTALGGASARNHPSVSGSPALRVVSWIGYGLTLVDAAFLLGISFEQEVSTAHIASVGALGVLTLIGFSVDALVAAGEAESVGSGSGLRLRPTMALTPDGGGSVAGFFGVTGEL